MTFEEVGVDSSQEFWCRDQDQWRSYLELRLGKYMEWAAVDTLVKLTKGNVDAAHTS